MPGRGRSWVCLVQPRTRCGCSSISPINMAAFVQIAFAAGYSASYKVGRFNFAVIAGHGAREK